MTLRDSRPRRTAGATVVAALVTVLSGCGQTTPTGPTSIAANERRDLSTSVAAANTSATHSTNTASPSSLRGAPDAGATVSWECFIAGMSGGWGGATDCPRSRGQVISTQDTQVSPLITAAPLNLQRLVLDNIVTLSWTPPPAPNQPTSYVVEAGSTSGAANIAVFDTGSTGTILTVSGVPPGTYFVRVRARDASGTGPASNEVIVVVPRSEPAPSPCNTAARAPRNLVGIPVGLAVILDWNGPHPACPDPDYFIIHAGSAPGASNLAQVTTEVCCSYGVPVVSPGTYYVRVLAVFGTLVGPPSNEVVVTVTGVDPPGTTMWVGLVANGEGLTAVNDPDCGSLRGDITLRIVQTGNSLFAIATFTIRSAATCPEAVGFTFVVPASGTVTGSLAGGSASFSLTDDEGSIITGTVANGRMTGTVVDDDGTATFVLRRQ